MWYSTEWRSIKSSWWPEIYSDHLISDLRAMRDDRRHSEAQWVSRQSDFKIRKFILDTVGLTLIQLDFSDIRTYSGFCAQGDSYKYLNVGKYRVPIIYRKSARQNSFSFNIVRGGMISSDQIDVIATFPRISQSLDLPQSFISAFNTEPTFCKRHGWSRNTTTSTVGG